MIGAILKLHDRAWLLSSVFRFLGELRDRYGLHVVALLDRPDPGVLQAWRAHRSLFRETTISLNFAVVGPEGEQFARADNLALEAFEDSRPDWVFMADSDRWLESGYEEELDDLFARDRYDVANVRSLFFWEPTKVRLDFFVHCSPALWRWRPDVRYPLDRNLWTPALVLEEAREAGRVTTLRTRFIDYGYVRPEDREQIAARFFAAGKTDAVTLNLLSSPRELVDWDLLRDNKGIPQLQ